MVHGYQCIPDIINVQQDYVSSLAALGVETIALPSVVVPGGLQLYSDFIQKIPSAQKIHVRLTVVTVKVAAAFIMYCISWVDHEFPDGELGYYKEKLDLSVITRRKYLKLEETVTA